MKNIKKILEISLNSVLKKNKLKILTKIDSQLNLISKYDSLIIVELIIETESNLEKEYGFYKTLANENTFDFQKSPLKNWKIWNEYVNKLYEK